MAVFALGFSASARDGPNAALDAAIPDDAGDTAPADDADDAEPADDAGDTAPADGSTRGCSRGEELADAGVEPCLTQSGVLLEPATPGTVLVTHAESLSLAPAQFSGQGPRAVLGLPAAAVQAETSDGETVVCSADMGGYFCPGWGVFEPLTSELRSVSVRVGDQTWTKPIGICSSLDHRTDFRLDDVAGCVDPGAVVLEGTLLGYSPDQAAPANVGLFGKTTDLIGSELDPMFIPDRRPTIPYRPCAVEGDRYVCTTIGFRETATHRLRVQIGEHILDEVFDLEVHGCEVQALHADIRACPLLPEPLQVEVRAAGDGPLPPLVATAAYEGGLPYPCVEAQASTRDLTRFLCPAALASQRGEGRYEIVASDGERSFRAVYERRSNGCVVSAGPLVLGPGEAGDGSHEEAHPEDPDAGSIGEDACADAGTGAPRAGCPELQGYIGGPLAPGTIHIKDPSSSSPISRAWPPEMLNLTSVVDAVQAETADGRTIDCPHETRYVCKDKAGIVSVSVFVGEQSWTEHFREEHACPIDASEEFVSFWLDDLAWCVEPGTVVLEGTLLGYEPAGGMPVSVDLIGERFGYAYVTDPLGARREGYPSRACEVSGDRYRCTTIGHRTTSTLSLRVTLGDHQAMESFRLPVEDCEARVMRADMEVCPLTPLHAEFFVGEDTDLPQFQVTASHAGGALYPCVDVSYSPSSRLKRFACPAALGSSHGAGTYEVVATGGGRIFRGTYERTFDGCATSDGPLTLIEQVANGP